SQANEVLIRAEMVVFFTPIFLTDHIWFNNDMLANLEVINAGSQLGHSAGKFVAQRNGSVLACDRVRMALTGNEHWAIEVFVQVSATNATPSDINEYFAGSYGRGLDVFDTNIFLIIVTCSTHRHCYHP